MGQSGRLQGGKRRMKRPSIESQLFDALAFAAHKHRRQRRKDVEASPYINHPIALARTLAVEGRVVDTRTLIAAVLHDTVEDTDTTFERSAPCSAPRSPTSCARSPTTPPSTSPSASA